MSVKTPGITNKMLLVLFLAVMLFTGFAFAQVFDLTYDDPEGDVEDMEGNTYKEGYEHLDILEISSSENILGTQLILEMTVTGVITDSEEITYTFYLMDKEEWIYIVTYSNGVGTGMNMEDGSTDVLQASGSGTSTLEVRVQMSNVGEISEFDFWSETSEYGEDQYLWDYAPDSGPGWDDDDFGFYEMPVMITEPRPGATVSGTKITTGVTDPYYEMVSVEIQFDSQSEGGWILTSTNDDWETWRCEWQSTGLPDGEHTINARGYDGTEYHFDSITVYVDQSNALSPPTTDVPTLKVGDELHYTMDMSMLEEEDLLEGMEMEMSTEMTMKVNKKESIEVNGIRYETYVIDMTMSMSLIMTYEGESMTSSATGEGTQWLRVSDLATIKAFTETSYSSYGITTSSKSTVTYDPPMNDYNFPMIIAETWTSTCTITIEDTYTYDGEPDTETDSYEAIMEYEALHVEDVTVLAGTYETFVIWSMETTEDYYGGGGTPFFGSSPGYTLNYYSPDIGFPVKSESYYPNRELYMSMELVSYREAGSGPGKGPGSFGGDLPMYFLLIPIFVAVILASAIAVKRRRKRAATMQTWDQYAVGSEIPGQASQPVAPPSQVYTAQPHPAQVPRAYQLQTAMHTSPPPPPVQPSRAYVPPPPPSKVQQAGIYPTQTPRSVPPPPPPRLQETSQYPQHPQQSQQPVSPLIQTKCPRCSNLFSVQKGAARVQCPHCGVSGKMQW